MKRGCSVPLLTNQRSRLLGGGRLAVPVPVLGAEILVNGNMETGNPPSSWTLDGGATVSSVSGLSGQAMRAVRGASSQVATQAVSGAIGTWYYGAGYVKSTDGGRISMALGVSYETGVLSAGTWQAVNLVGRATTGGAKSFGLVVLGGAGKSSDFDSCSLKTITLASMFSTRPYSTHATTKAKATIVAGTRAGVVANLDSASSPANFVLASHDGTTARLTKYVAGTYTELISTTVAYVAGAYVEIRRPGTGDNWQLFYNGSQVGTDQTISDAAIKAATLAGYFQTYSGNTLTDFSCVPSA